MIVGAKSLQDQEAFCGAELKELFQGMDQMLQGGPPPEVPAAIPIGQLARIVATLKRSYDLCKMAVDAEDDTAIKDEEFINVQASYIKAMRALVEVAPPKAPPRILPA